VATRTEGMGRWATATGSGTGRDERERSRDHQGDPTKAGAPFVLRLRSSPGAKIPPHWHAIDENFTVLSGTFCVGTGYKFDENACKDMPAGSHFVMPKGMHHFAVAKGDVVQIHGGRTIQNILGKIIAFGFKWFIDAEDS
jgi:hypothetical protein